MIDPVNMTQYGLSKNKLEEVLLFSCAVAGKKALTTARVLDEFLEDLKTKAKLKTKSPFELIKNYKGDLPKKLRSHGMGCYNHRAKTFKELADSDLNLKECTVEELESISGIGPKTSRFFILHTRQNINNAALDVHILKFMSDLGYKVPSVTPPAGKKYKEIEKQFISIAKKSKLSIAEFDLTVWRVYSGTFTEKDKNFVQKYKEKHSI